MGLTKCEAALISLIPELENRFNILSAMMARPAEESKLCPSLYAFCDAVESRSSRHTKKYFWNPSV